jgi:hypothetical protein
MRFTLCYKEYSFNMTLGAMKQFKDATGKDLWHTLLAFLDEWMASEGKSTLARCRAVYDAVDFETASELIHCLVKSEDKSIPLIEVEDAMFRVGWLPMDLDNQNVNPYPLILVSIAHDINKMFESELEAVKKSHAPTEQAESKS